MMLSKKQTALYEAVSNIGSHYIEETITAPVRFTPAAWKRIAAAAAMLALIIGLGFFFRPHEKAPYLSIQANAVSSENAQRIPIDYVEPTAPEWLLGAPHYRPPTEWGSNKLFKFGIYIHNIPREYRSIRTDVEIIYNDSVVDRYSNDANFEIIPTLGGDEERHLTGIVYGWLPEDTLLNINVYVYKNDERILFQSQTVLITVSSGYALEILASEINENIEWSELS